jgi:ring-1,2-phenylacetyl-CoA epoxidase subunit PaaA
MVQDAVNRWWWKCLAMFGPPMPTARTAHTACAGGIKRVSNDELRQKFIGRHRAAGQGARRHAADPDLKWNEERQHYDHGQIDWAEFWETVNGNGPCNKERLGTRVKAHNDGQWGCAMPRWPMPPKQQARDMRDAA